MSRSEATKQAQERYYEKNKGRILAKQLETVKARKLRDPEFLLQTRETQCRYAKAHRQQLRLNRSRCFSRHELTRGENIDFFCMSLNQFCDQVLV